MQFGLGVLSVASQAAEAAQGGDDAGD